MAVMRALLELLMPPTCAGCGVEGEVLCAPCRAPLRRRLDEPAGVPLGMPAQLPDGLLQLEWCATYSGPVRAAIAALKYRGERGLARTLGTALAERWARAGAGGTLLTWVPVHPSRRRERGFDQAELIARAAGAALGLPTLGAIRRARQTTAQHALGRSERAANVGGVFVTDPAYRAHLEGRWVVVVDDVVTTGATLGGCAQALLDGGAEAVSAITVARDR